LGLHWGKVWSSCCCAQQKRFRNSRSTNYNFRCLWIFFESCAAYIIKGCWK